MAFVLKIILCGIALLTARAIYGEEQHQNTPAHTPIDEIHNGHALSRDQLPSEEQAERALQNPTERHRRSISAPPSWLDEERQASTAPAATQFFSDFFHMVLTLSFVLIIILLMTWGLKRLMASRLTQMNVTSTIKILERRALSPKAIVYLIEVGQQKILIAESPAGVHRIGNLMPGDIPEAPGQGQGQA